MLDGRIYRVSVRAGALLGARSRRSRWPSGPGRSARRSPPTPSTGGARSSTLTELRRTYPEPPPGQPGRRRAGAPGRAGLPRRVHARARCASCATSAETIDGEATLTSVDRRARRPRQPAASSSSPTATRPAPRRRRGCRAPRRCSSWRGCSEGARAAAHADAHLDERRDRRRRRACATRCATLAGPDRRRPRARRRRRASRRGGRWSIPWSESSGTAPLRLRRTVENARAPGDRARPGRRRGRSTQLARLAVPLTLTPQGAAGARGLSAVTRAGQRRARARRRTPRSRGRGCRRSGAASLRSISALDNGPDVPAGPREYLVVQRRVLPTLGGRR